MSPQATESEISVQPFRWAHWWALCTLVRQHLAEDGIDVPLDLSAPDPGIASFADSPEADLDLIDRVYLRRGGGFWIAWLGDEPVGHVGAQDVGRAIELRRMWVREPYRSCGVGRQLVRALIDHSVAQGIGSVEVWTADDGPGRALYEDMGFRTVAEPGAAFLDKRVLLARDPGEREIRMRLDLADKVARWERAPIATVTVNGAAHQLELAPGRMLVDVLRRDLGLTGTKVGCGEGQCGSCTVVVQERAVRSCTLPARRAAYRNVLTVEGLAGSWGSPDALHPLQRAFIDHGVIQCGFCTPGMLMSAVALWNRASAFVPTPDVTEAQIRRALERNACRCTGYASVLRALRSAFHELQTGEPLPPLESDTVAPLTVVGRSYPRPDAVAKVTGQARYADDLAFDGMLYGATLRAAHPHARIVSIDTTAASAAPGVHAVLTHVDVPGRNRHGLVYHDWPVLCDDKVRYLGDAVALVAAETPEDAARARDLVAVTYEPLPVVEGPGRAREPDAPLVHDERAEGNLLAHIKVRHGEVEEGFAAADVVVEGEYRTPIYDHMFLEPECSIGIPAGYDAQHAKLTVYVGSQIPYADRAQIAAALDLPEDEVRVIGTPIGGAFGGKEDITGQIHAALLARATGRPVKVLYSRAESMLVHPKRHATVIRIAIGARLDGLLTAVRAELLGDAGAYASLSTKVLERATTHASGPYAVPHVQVDCYAMYTNNPPAGAFRGFGVTQATFAVESTMDMLAEALGADPVALRRKNALRVGTETATGQLVRESAGLDACLEWVAQRTRALPLPAIPGARVAWGFAAAYKNTGLGGGADDAAEAEVELYADGTAEVRSSSADLGQGLTTVLAQMAAEELGLPFDRVRVLLSDTDLTPDGGPTTASRQTYVTGNAARLAACALRERLAAVASERWDLPPSAIRVECGKVWAEGHKASLGDVVQWLVAEGRTPRVRYHYRAPETKPLGQGGDMHFAFGYSAQAALVAVDEVTGEPRVLRIVAACDAGRAINPRAVLGQIEGGLVMGIGTALSEAYELADGIPQTRRWRDYGVPMIDRMPEMEVHIVEHPTAEGPYGAKGIGELPSIPTAPAICNAIYAATGVRVRVLPVRRVPVPKGSGG
ncbi:MAG: GNAT family N-acetyltransferase [Anaerolineae bacterium]|nr:GNAT family N-acetyltransferase [Anaerolineae bacterium]